jgi:hypothetical protein
VDGGAQQRGEAAQDRPALDAAQEGAEESAPLQDEEAQQGSGEDREPERHPPADGCRDARVIDDQGQPGEQEGEQPQGLGELRDRDGGHHRRGGRLSAEHPGAHELAAQGRGGGQVVHAVAGQAGEQEPGKGDGRAWCREGRSPRRRVGRDGQDLLQDDGHDPPPYHVEIGEYGLAAQPVDEDAEEHHTAGEEQPLGDPGHAARASRPPGPCG